MKAAEKKATATHIYGIDVCNTIIGHVPKQLNTGVIQPGGNGDDDDDDEDDDDGTVNRNHGNTENE